MGNVDRAPGVRLVTDAVTRKTKDSKRRPRGKYYPPSGSLTGNRGDPPWCYRQTHPTATSRPTRPSAARPSTMLCA